MKPQLTIDEFLLVIKKVIDYIGPGKLDQIIMEVRAQKEKPKTSADFLSEINNFKGIING